LRLRLKYESPVLKYPLTIRLDFALGEKPAEVVTSPVIRKFPLVFFPLISHLGPEEILAEKIRALLVRGKGRDLFDCWFLLGKGIKINPLLLRKKMGEINQKFTKKLLEKRIAEYSSRDLRLDLDRFLPGPQRKITPLLKQLLLEKIAPSKL